MLYNMKQLCITKEVITNDRRSQMSMTPKLAKRLEKEFGKDSEVYKMLVKNAPKETSEDQVTYTGALNGSGKNKQD